MDEDEKKIADEDEKEALDGEKRSGKGKYLFIVLAAIAVIAAVAIFVALRNDKETQENETQDIESETSESDEIDSEAEADSETDSNTSETNETDSETELENGTESNTSETDETDRETETKDITETDEETISQIEPFEIDLTAGNYTIGTDIPAGIYNLTAESGSGNVRGSNTINGGINETMANPADEYSIDFFSNAKFDSGNTLSIGGTLSLHLQSDKADTGSMTARTSPDAAPIGLGSGKFISGTDFPAGIYTIVATGPSGTVNSSNIYNGGLKEIMSNEDDENSIREFKNASLPKGTTLTISNTSVQLIKVGE